jgi:hypothetical protein
LHSLAPWIKSENLYPEKHRGRHTGKTIGIPPLTALVPSCFDASDNQSFSFPRTSVQLIMVAPYNKISTLSPVGRVAITRELLSVMLTCGCGAKPGVVARAAGFFERSTILAIIGT